MSANSIYESVELFKSLGFKRRVCPKCKAAFWSIASETCGDAPCTHYTFFNISTKSLGYRDVIKRFLEFFRRHGHEVIEPRPVVARWREDLYLTIASIVVFQPHVTSGLVPPPANPLVIAQPCIRLEDIDNVGYTFGRHLTNFVMGGHHAFNYPDKWVYWINETVEFAFKFFTEEIGVPAEVIAFKESWWEGGGNAGPCLEVSVGGLEVATLVFMMYRTRDSGYEEIPLKIVDTGYGMERIAWLASKAPTAFHAVYGDLLDELHRRLSIPKPDEEVIKTAAIFSPLHFSSEKGLDLDSLAKRVAEVLGVSYRDVVDQLKPVFDLYAVLDHSKTVAIMLSDGVVPSNSGEGYLARLVIRRCLRRLAKLRRDASLVDIVDLQLRYWSDLYPNMTKMRNLVLEMVQLEEEKFREVFKKISTVIPKLMKRKPSLDDFVMLYDSMGIPPDLVKEELEKKGIVVEIPPNFYSIVASRHMKPPTLKGGREEKIPKEVVQWAKNFSRTRFLFHEDPYLRVFKARVLGVYDRYLVLDQTAFYPEGGGQLGDVGWIEVKGSRVRVVDTQKINGVVVHVLEKPIDVVEGTEVVGEIDWSIRYRRMKHHTATHIVLGAIRRVLGEHIWQAGAEKTEHKARLDVTHYKLPGREEIERIERLANSVVEQRLPVKVQLLPRNDAEKIYGYTLYQGGVPMEPTIRVVEIPGWDAEACFGTHVGNTSEVGGIKIVNVERIADGVVRFEFVASTALVDHATALYEKLEKVARNLGVGIDQIEHRISSLIEELSRYREIVKIYRKELLGKLIEAATTASLTLGNIKLFIYTPPIDDRDLIRELLIESTSREPKLIAVVITPKNGNSLVEISIGKDALSYIDARRIVNEIRRRVNARGGGKQDHATALIWLPIEKAREIVEEVVRSIIATGNQS